MTSTHHRLHIPQRSDHHPDAPAFHAGNGGFRSARVLGSDLGHDGTCIDVGALAVRHLVMGRTTEIRRRAAKEEIKRRAAKERPHPKSHLDLLKEGAHRLARVDFGNPIKMDTWDKMLWEKGVFQPPGEPASAREWALILNEGVPPADAVLWIFDHVDLWSFDCAMFVQAVLLYAVVKRIGKESFNQRVASRKATDGKMMLRSHTSPGLLRKGGSQHEKPAQGQPPWSRERIAAVMREQEDNFKAAANGSQIVFTNLDPRANETVFEHENAIKIGPDKFIAHGIAHHHPFVSREQIYKVLAEAAAGIREADAAYKKSHLYISVVELYGDGGD
jgi:hypothetical protein